MRIPLEERFGVVEAPEGVIKISMTRRFAEDLAGALGEDSRWEEVNAVREALLAALDEGTRGSGGGAAR